MSSRRVRRLSTSTWQTVGRPTVLIPLGSTEQHGPHLPLSTDTDIARAVSVAVVERSARSGAKRLLLGPPLHYGASGEHQDFPGTISIGTTALISVVLELGRSLSNWAESICIINGHGGNLEALRAAVPRLRAEGVDAGWVPCAAMRPDADAHAGYDETSIMLHLAPELVRTELIETGDTRALSRILPLLQRDGVRAVSPNGVLGDPRRAHHEAGERLLAAMSTGVEARVDAWRAQEDGMLQLPEGAAHRGD